MKVWGGEVLQAGVLERERRCSEEDVRNLRHVCLPPPPPPFPPPFPTPWSLLQLDSEDAEPNFDEDGQDEYNELHMPV